MLCINDTTLRDGEQTAGVAFSAQEKLALAKLLAQAGVTHMEVGTPAMGLQECQSIAAIRKALPEQVLMGWCRAKQAEIKTAAELGLDWVDISIPSSEQMIQHKLQSSKQALIESLQASIEYALSLGLKVCVGCEDASRAELSFLVRLGRIAHEAGAGRLRYADTLGILEPFSTFEQISILRSAQPLDIEIHCHDDLGLATANTLAAVKAGANYANTTVVGLGERAGNAPLEEVVAALHQCYQWDLGIDLKSLPKLCKAVACAAGRCVPKQKSVVGSAVFTHESGIHVDGLVKDVRNYQGLDPKLLGRNHHLVLGKHSGKQAVQAVFSQIGITLEPELLPQILSAVQDFAVCRKRNPSKQELLEIKSQIEQKAELGFSVSFSGALELGLDELRRAS